MVENSISLVVWSDLSEDEQQRLVCLEAEIRLDAIRKATAIKAMEVYNKYNSTKMVSCMCNFAMRKRDSKRILQWMKSIQT